MYIRRAVAIFIAVAFAWMLHACSYPVKNGNNMHDSIFNDELKRAFETFVEKTKQPAVKLTPVRRKTSVYDSKFGGTPYLPPGFSYPHDEYPGRGRPLVLLAQLNFATLPRLEGFPDHGILQFYISDWDLDDKFITKYGVFGANDGDVNNQSGFKVVYHENIVTDEKLLGALPDGAVPTSEAFPFKGEFALIPSIVDSVPHAEDYRFDKIISRFNRDNPSYAIMDDDSEYLEIFFSDELKLYGGSRIGGYPYFAQYDHRREKYTVLLLQVDSEGKDMVNWGDGGVANFFITPEDLAKLDFSRLIFIVGWQ